MYANAVRTAAGSVKTLTKTAVGVPVVGDLTGWAVEEAILYLLSRVQAVFKVTKQLAELAKLLQNGPLQRNLIELDLISDTPGFPYFRQSFNQACELLAEVDFIVAKAEADRNGKAAWWRKVRSSLSFEHKTHLKQELEALSQDRVFLELRTARNAAMRAAASPVIHTAGVVNGPGPPPLQQRTGPPESEEQDPPPLPRHPIVHHGTHVARSVHHLLGRTRNVGIVGMGGIGKTTVARAVYDRAEATGTFHKLVWLKVGRKPAIVRLLKAAFDKLFGDTLSYDFSDDNPGQALSSLVHRVYAKEWKVLLVLDDVWTSTHHEPAAVPALNFATHPSLKVEGSRLLVTTRQRSALSHAPHISPVALVPELEVVEVPRLSTQHAQQLFHACAFPDDMNAADDRFWGQKRSDLIAACGGNPRALVDLGFFVRPVRADPDQWLERLEQFEQEMGAGKDDASKHCADSITALPSSVMDCFVAFAAFPAGTEVPEANLMHLFATHAPLHTGNSVRAAARKLDDLVQRSLVTESTSGLTGRRLFSMHPILHRIASRMAKGQLQPLLVTGEDAETSLASSANALASSFAYHFEPSRHEAAAGSTHYLSMHACHRRPLSEALELYTRAGDQGKLHACVMSEVHCPPAPQPWPPRLRYLLLGRSAVHASWTPDSPPVGDLRGVSKLLVLHSLSLARMNLSETALGCLLPAGQLLHLDLSGCDAMTQLPDCIRSCTHLIHLNLSLCSSLSALSEAIAQLGRLMDLDLSKCASLEMLSESMATCGHLMHLVMSGCSHANLTSVPKGLIESPSLLHLDLSECSSVQRLPDVFPHRNSLRHVDLSGCARLASLPPSLEYCSHLTHLNLSGCSGLHKLGVNLSGCQHLAHVSLCANPWLTSVPQCISSIRCLVSLDLSRCTNLQTLPCHRPNTGSSVKYSLTHLKLRGCVSIQKLPNVFTGYQKLVHLDVQDCSKHSFSLPLWIRKCTYLTHLNLKGCAQLSKLPRSISYCTRLAYLCLDGCSMVELPGTIWDPPQPGCQAEVGCINLTQLDLTGCSGLKELPESIGRCSHLAHLCLNRCSSLSDLPPSIRGSTQLTHLDLRSCVALQSVQNIIDGQDNGRVPAPAGQCVKQLVFLSLSGWDRCRAFPVATDLIPHLTCLDLSNCVKLTRLPTTIGWCKQLAHLNLQNCPKLKGLPADIGSCVQLAHLYLRQCTRLQHLPPEICNCRQLQHVDLVHCPAGMHLKDDLPWDAFVRVSQVAKIADED